MAKKDPKITLRPHVYDGIQEYDQRLPNWWLFTLYAAIVFSVVFWFFSFQSNLGQTDSQQIAAEMNRIQTIKLANSIDVENNDLFWEMAANDSFIAAGKATYDVHCVACHNADLSGGIGENLTDNQWKHGHLPSQIYATIYDGISDKGMPAQGTILGQKAITEVVAYILSHHADRATMEAEAVVKTD
ncbi:MAG: cbb3-type cytochrome c oxidase N-terminal domain-containing protein [Verrucomicrobiota bacterium]